MFEADCHPKSHRQRWKPYPNFWRLYRRDLSDLLLRGKECHDHQAISQAQFYAMHCKLEKHVSLSFDNSSSSGFSYLCLSRIASYSQVLHRRRLQTVQRRVRRVMFSESFSTDVESEEDN